MKIFSSVVKDSNVNTFAKELDTYYVCVDLTTYIREPDEVSIVIVHVPSAISHGQLMAQSPVNKGHY